MKKTLITALCLLASVSLASCGENTNKTNTESNNNSQSVVRKPTLAVTGNLKTTVGHSVQLKITLKNDTAGYTTSSSDEAVATISDTGLVTGVSVGTCTLTVASVTDPTVKKELEFTVVDENDVSVSIDASDTTVEVNNSITLKAVVTNKNNGTVTYKWAASNKGIGAFNKTTSEEATFTGKNIGETEITLTCVIDGVEVSDSVTITVIKNTSDAVKISTADEFKTSLLVSGRLDKDYILTADIDLGGYKIDGYKNAATFAGTLNGNGHKVSNFEIISSEPQHANSAMWKNIDGEAVIENVEFDGKIGVDGIGWGSAILGNVVSGTIKNCLFQTEQTYNNGSDSWFPFGGTIAGVLKESAVLEDCVVTVSGEGKDVNMAFAIYPAGGSTSDGTNAGFAPSTQTFTCTGLYTSQSAALAYGSAWEWGGPIEDKTGIHCAIDFTTAPASTYADLDATVWDLQDNKMPTLKVITE